MYSISYKTALILSMENISFTCWTFSLFTLEMGKFYIAVTNWNIFPVCVSDISDIDFLCCLAHTDSIYRIFNDGVSFALGVDQTAVIKDKTLVVFWKDIKKPVYMI